MIFSKEVIARAKKIQVSNSVIMCRKFPKLDMRYNFNKEVKRYLNYSPLTKTEIAIILEKRRVRYQRKEREYKNVLSNPLVVDYIKRGKGCMVYCNHLRFGDGRNHWAKTFIDFKILSILEKYNKKIKIY